MQELKPVDRPLDSLIITPHPVVLDGQRIVHGDLRDGETLADFLGRHVDLSADAWEVKVGGVVVPVQLWSRVKPKHGQVIEVRGAVGKQALYIVAMVALIWFTGGLGAGAAGSIGASGIGGVMFGAGTLAATAANAAIFMAGAMIINKVLGPKVDAPDRRQSESAFNIAGARNQLRQYEPLGLNFGISRYAPDILSQPYSWYEGNDQYLGMVLTPGLNVDRFEDLRIGDTPIESYEGVTVWTSGFPGMPEQDIPLFSNADTIAGGELQSNGTWVTRVTSPDTVRIMVNVEYMLGDMDSKGREKYNHERVEVHSRVAGSSGPFTPLTWREYRNNNFDPKRDTLQIQVPKGQYEIRVRRMGWAIEYSNGRANFQFTTLTSVQADEADYRGIPRIGIKIKATGQLNGTPDQIRATFFGRSMPVWNGTSWGTATTRATGLSNPGALIVAYARGLVDPGGSLVAGIGFDDWIIDLPAFQGFMRHCAANGYTYDFWQQSPRSHAEVLDSIALAGFGQITWAGGRLSIAWAADGQPVSGVVNMATIKRGTFQVDYTLAGAADGVEYTYFDRDVWDTRTLRVPAPGVVTMLNPARLTGEGVTTEAHAAEMARYHLAQSLYQYKDIRYSTDLEHMTYRRLSRLALSHDLTKWGSSGRVVSANVSGGVATIVLDAPVVPPASGDAYIGVRIPGEMVFRVLKVAAFTGETDTVTLADPWPKDAPVPGSTPGNPAHDSIWIYDFKATPGYSVRVISIEPESGLKGATVAVVPEGPDFWTYVKTGAYVPPVAPPVRDESPVVSNLVIGERQVIQGDTEFTELVATFDVTGYTSRCVVYCAEVGQPLEEVAETTTRTARWRIPRAGEYSIVVRPFDEDGDAGQSASATYITQRADTPPPVFDIFEIQELPGGVRKYVWGYFSTTTEAANLAGAEIRYIAGSNGAPVWDDMTPLGAGFFTSAFEMVLPHSGTWTFAIRARNTAGILSNGQKVVIKTLGANLGEELDNVTQEQADIQDAVDQAAYDAAQAQATAADALGRAITLEAEVDSLGAQIGDVLGAGEWSAAETYSAGDIVKRDGKLYRALGTTIGDPPESSPSAWQLIGDYASLGEAVAASIATGQQNASDIAAESSRLDAVVARLPSGSGSLATQAMVASESAARVAGDEALATLVNAATTTANGAQSTAASALTAASNAASVASTATTTANGASTAAASALTAANNAATAVTQVRADLPGGGNMLRNSTFAGLDGWTVASNGFGGSVAPNDGELPGDPGRYIPPGTTSLMLNATGTHPHGTVLQVVSDYVPVENLDRLIASCWVNAFRCNARLTIYYYSRTGAYLGEVYDQEAAPAKTNPKFSDLPRAVAQMQVSDSQAELVRVGLEMYSSGEANPYAWFILPMLEKVQEGKTEPSPWTEGAAGLSSATFALKAAQDAQITLTTNVNGHVSGLYSNNDGVRSDFSILADVFRVIGGPAEGMEWQDGYLRVYGSGYQSIIGYDFGSPGEGLVRWFGPNIGASACTKANGTIWESKDGTAYFGGEVLQGVLRAFNSSTTVSTTASVETGVVNTKNKTVAVRGTFTYSAQQANNGASSVFVPDPNTSTRASMVLERRYRNANETGWDAWVQLATRDMIGSSAVLNQTGDPSYMYWDVEGSISATDVASPRRREYRVRLTSFVRQGYTVTNPGAYPALIQNQYQSIESME